MSYTTLKEIYYKNESQYEKTYSERANAISTQKIPLFIHSKYDHTYQLFVVILPEFLKLVENIEQKIAKRPFLKDNQLKSMFYQHYLLKLLVDEIQITNEIEGVDTKKEDIQNGVLYNENSEMKHHFIIDKYYTLISEQIPSLTSPKDIRQIYDDLLKQEISVENLPDGKLFRKKQVHVYKRSGKSSTPIHTGLYPEDNITNAINNLLLFLAASEYSFFIKVAVTHYYLGYIHPFYDGNGRLSRFISTVLINQEKDALLAFKLSKVIKDNIKQYDENFDLCNSDQNKGDLTPFVLMFLQMLDAACDEINNEVNQYKVHLHRAQKYLDSIDDLTVKNEKPIVFIIYQANLLEMPIVIKDIAKQLKKSRDSIRKYVNKIIKKNYIIKTKVGRVNSLSLTTEFREQIETGDVK